MDGLFLFRELKERYLSEIAEKDKNSVENYLPGLCECTYDLCLEKFITREEQDWLILEIYQDVPDGKGGFMFHITDKQSRIDWLDSKIAEWTFKTEKP